MSVDEFNKKYYSHIGKGHYGLAIHNPKVINMLDLLFEDLVHIPGFEFYQIKSKFDNVRFYSNLGDTLNGMIEKHIDWYLND